MSKKKNKGKTKSQNPAKAESVRVIIDDGGQLAYRDQNGGDAREAHVKAHGPLTFLCDVGDYVINFKNSTPFPHRVYSQEGGKQLNLSLGGGKGRYNYSVVVFLADGGYLFDDPEVIID